MTDFVKELSACRVGGTQLPFYPEKVQGYTEQEVELIAKNLNLDIHGQFRDFLLQIGKCSGGLLLSDEFYMYDYRCEKDFFINYQKNIQEDDYMFDNQGKLDPVGKKYFFYPVNMKPICIIYLLLSRIIMYGSLIVLNLQFGKKLI